MCEGCAHHFDRLWSGMPLEEYLAGLPGAVLVVDGDTRVVTLNDALARLIGVERSSVVGLHAGEALSCVRSRPSGCGKTARCRECPVRRTVEQVALTGRMRERVPAQLETSRGRMALHISGRPCLAGSVALTIEPVRAGRAAPRGRA
jgi:PAS domain-containing protein